MPVIGSIADNGHVLFLWLFFRKQLTKSVDFRLQFLVFLLFHHKLLFGFSAFFLCFSELFIGFSYLFLILCISLSCMGQN